ncbi:organic solute transporter Ostalpha-domain-containing protein [Sporodiniella umbellata]|nr:organic solute transporter Ostalpha-domain-containing protein [Sporodiniella umbellata]
MSEKEAVSCPTEPGLSSMAGFKPGLDWSYVKEDPTANWHVIGWLVCLLFLLITWIVTLTTLFRHLRNYYNPEIQRHKLRVILFPPVYATLSWFAYLRYDYSTTIKFFATCFEAFAVYNLYTCLQAYLQPFRDESEGVKEPRDTKIMFVKKLHLPSKWGMHYRIITDFLVVQYPVWSLLDAFMSIFAELKGHYCAGSYSFKGAYVYLTIINFISLSIILTALFTYLDVYHAEWQRGKIRAHGMFWCVKGPIMVIFYFGEILLTILTTTHVIKETDGTHGSIAWPAEAVKNGLYVIIVCVCMAVVSCMMAKFFGPADDIEAARLAGAKKQKGMFGAFVDGYVAYIPEFIYKIICCGVDSVKLAKKRKALKKRRTQNPGNVAATNDTNGLLKDDYMEYRMEEVNSGSQPSGHNNLAQTSQPQAPNHPSRF